MADWPAAESTMHVAPEPQTAQFLEATSRTYVSIDLRPGIAMRQEDLTALSFPDGSFSLVFCSHVLEHIPDDMAAIREIRRVLDPSGVAMILVPIRGDITNEEPLDDPEERYRQYGLADHVRLYGLDILERLGSSFAVGHRVTSEWSTAERLRLGLGTEEHAFICRPM